MFTITTAAIPPFVICAYFIFPACNVTNSSGYNYLTDTGFSSVSDCITFLSSLPATQPCPYEQRSNTTGCRALHALSSFFLPNVHCSHVKPDSHVCREQCLPACSNCDANAKCIATFPGFPSTPGSFSPVYKCQCNNGYIGNGTSCQSILCSNGNCPAPYGSYDCSTGSCMCTSTYTTQPELLGTGNSLCTCPSPNTVQWIGGSPMCLPIGRCVNDSYRYMCNLQQYSQVKCVPLNNDFQPLGGCMCNYGFNGGWEYPCTCVAPGRILWSDSFDGKVCLLPGKCTKDYPDCNRDQTCFIQAGQQVGTCASKKRDN